MLQESAARNLTNNATIISKHCKVDSGEWSILSDKTSRNSDQPIKEDLKSAPFLETHSFRYTIIRAASVAEIKTALSTQHRARLINSPPSSGGKVPRLKVKKSDKSQRNRDRRFRDMEIFLGIQAEIDQGLAGPLVGISAPEVLTALE